MLAEAGRDRADFGREVEMIRPLSVCVVMTVAGLLSSGCGVFDKKESGTVQAGGSAGAGQPEEAPDMTLPMPQAQPPISDVPVPIDYKIDEGKSRNYAVAGVRFVDHVYTGKGDKFVVKRFYERYMVMNRWTLATFIFAQGRIMLDFEKDYERCRVTIWESNFLGPTTVSVLLWPNRPPPADGETPKT